MTAPARGVDDFLADLDAVLADTPTPGEPAAPNEPEAPTPPVSPAPADEPTAPTEPREPREPELVPDLTQPAPEVPNTPSPARTRTIKTTSGRLPDWWLTDKTSDLTTTKPEPEPEPAKTEPVEPEPVLSLTKTTAPEPDEPDNKPDEPSELTDQQGAPGAPTVVTTPTSTARLIATTVQDWRPPPGPRGKGWVRAIIYNGSGIAVAFLTGITRNTYIALDQMAINPDAVAGIGLSAAIAALMISRSKWTWISLGIALAMVLLIRMLTLPVFTGLLAAFIAWGLDQWIRTMRQPFAWTARAAFTTLALATFALVWTTVVPALTGAHQ